MRKHAIRLVALLSLLSGFALAQTPPPSAPALKPFLSPDGRCSLLMPGIPQYDAEEVPLKTGEKVQMNEYYVELDNRNVSYMLMYNDYPPDAANLAPEVMLEGFRDGASAGKTLLTDTAITLDGVPGRAFTTIDKDGWLYDVHQFFVNKRLYQLIIVTNKGYTATYRDTFMNSFHIK
jgi:hypothetical protein